MSEDLKAKIAEAFQTDRFFSSEDIVEAALQAIHDAGFAVVPREPTEAMWDACMGDDMAPPEVWTAMILASQPKGEGE